MAIKHTPKFLSDDQLKQSISDLESNIESVESMPEKARVPGLLGHKKLLLKDMRNELASRITHTER